MPPRKKLRERRFVNYWKVENGKNWTAFEYRERLWVSSELTSSQSFVMLLARTSAKYSSIASSLKIAGFQHTGQTHVAFFSFIWTNMVASKHWTCLLHPGYARHGSVIRILPSGHRRLSLSDSVAMSESSCRISRILLLVTSYVDTKT